MLPGGDGVDLNLAATESRIPRSMAGDKKLSAHPVIPQNSAEHPVLVIILDGQLSQIRMRAVIYRRSAVY